MLERHLAHEMCDFVFRSGEGVAGRARILARHIAAALRGVRHEDGGAELEHHPVAGVHLRAGHEVGVVPDGAVHGEVGGDLAGAGEARGEGVP